MYVDEAGFDNREDYPYGYSPKGERCYALKSGKRTERVSWITALREKSLFAPLTFEGSCNRNLFEAWLKNCLIPQLNPGDIIIIDNATFHKGEAIKEIVEEGVITYLEKEFGGNLTDHLALVMIPGDLVVNGNNFNQWNIKL